MDHKLILECQHLSMQGKIVFPEVVARLVSAGVDSYDVDLVKKRIIYFDVYEQSLDLPLGEDDLLPAGEFFNVQEVARAIGRVQRREINYHAFIRQIMAAGVCRYSAQLNARQVVYYGSDGQSHAEPFGFAPGQR